jgi:DNA-binding CsgD family transcriptional regulator
MCVALVAAREIAAELYVTQRAVGQHLTKAYRKLGIAGRPQLVGVLRGRSGEPAGGELSGSTVDSVR